MHKTATTTLQALCKTNRAWLLERNVLYPRVLDHAPLPWPTFNHRFLSKRLDRPVSSADYQGTLAYWRDQYIPQLRAHPNHDVLISAERFWTLPQKQRKAQRVALLKELFQGYDVRVVAYVRRQDAWYEAMHNQHVKTHAEVRTIEEYVERGLARGAADLRSSLRFWANTFGRANVTVRAFERQQMRNESVVEDFLAQLGILEMNGLRIPQNSNPGLHPRLLGAKLTLNAYLTTATHRLVAKHGFLLAQRWIHTPREHTMPHALALRIMAHHAAGNARVARRFLGRKDGRLFESDPSDQDPWQHTSPHVWRPLAGP